MSLDILLYLLSCKEVFPFQKKKHFNRAKVKEFCREVAVYQKEKVCPVSPEITPDNFDEWSSHHITLTLCRSDFFLKCDCPTRANVSTICLAYDCLAWESKEAKKTEPWNCSCESFFLPKYWNIFKVRRGGEVHELPFPFRRKQALHHYQWKQDRIMKGRRKWQHLCTSNIIKIVVSWSRLLCLLIPKHICRKHICQSTSAAQEPMPFLELSGLS